MREPITREALTERVSEAVEAMSFLLQRGLKPEIRGGVLYVGPKHLLDDEARSVIRQNTAGLMAYLTAPDGNVEWRVAEMLAQLLPLAWPCSVPTLIALPDAEPNKEDCKSCGELLDVGEGNSFCCGLCARAKDIALSLWMQRPAQSVRAA